MVRDCGGVLNPRSDLTLHKPIQAEHSVAGIKNAGIFHVKDSLVIFKFFQVIVRLIFVEPLVKFTDGDLYDFLISVSV